MGADSIINARLVRADPPNGSLPLRNADEVKGNIVLIERGGGQFVNVIRVAQVRSAVRPEKSRERHPPAKKLHVSLDVRGC